MGVGRAAQLRVGESGATVTLGSQSVAIGPETLAARPALRDYDGRPLVVGIRPEDFEDGAVATGAPADHMLHTKVSLVESLGAEIMVHFSLDCATVDSGDPDAPDENVAMTSGTERRSNAVGRFIPKSRVRAGDTIDVVVATENMHFFDPDTHKAIWS